MAPVAQGGAEPKAARRTCDVRLLLVLLLVAALAAVLFFDVRLLQQETTHASSSSQPHTLHDHVWLPHANSAVPRPAFRPSEHWGADWIVVVTNYERDLEWLKEIPFHLGGIKLVVYVKQDNRSRRTCAQIPEAVKPHVAQCLEMKNSHGREAHTMARFMVENYDRLPRMMMFLQDDCSKPVDGSDGRWSCRLLDVKMSQEEWATFTDQAEADPFEDETCLCRVVTEINFRKCPPLPIPYEMRAGPGRCYGDRWFQVHQLLDIGVSDRVHPERPELRWAMYAQFAVPGWAVRSLPLSFHKMSLLLLDGSGDDLYDVASSTMVIRTAEIGRTWPSFEWAHAYERAWFALLDPKYSEKLDRDAALVPMAPWAPPQPPSPPPGAWLEPQEQHQRPAEGGQGQGGEGADGEEHGQQQEEKSGGGGGGGGDGAGGRQQEEPGKQPQQAEDAGGLPWRRRALGRRL